MKTQFVILFILLSGNISAQPGQLIFDHYGLEAGFNSREAMNIVTTPDGLVWISSNDGLVRYDSKNFKFYRHQPGDTTSLTHNYCLAMQTDRRGWIWIISDNDLEIFNPASETFRHIKMRNAKNEATPVYPLSFYYDNSNDVMWVSTVKGLYFSKGGSLSLQHFITGNAIPDSIAIHSVINGNADFLWLTCGSAFLKVNTKTGKVAEHYELPGIVDNIINNKTITYIRCAYLDDTILYLGTWASGLIEFNTVTKAFHQYCYSDYTKSQNAVSSIAKTGLPNQEHTLWLSASGFGFTAFNTATKSFTSYNTNQYNDPYGIKGTTYGLYAVNNDAMWIGSESGLHRYDYNKQIFTKIDLSSISNGVDLLPVNSMAVEKNNAGKDKKLWLQIPYKGGYIYDINRKKIMPLPGAVAKYINPPTNLFDFFIDSKNRLWISTNEYGLIGYDITAGRIILPEKKYFFQRWQWVNCFFEDSKKQIWLGTFNGLFLTDSSGTIHEVIAVNSELKKRRSAPGIVGLTEDKKGNIWFAADFSDKPNSAVGFYNKPADRATIVYDEQTRNSLYIPALDIRSILNKDDRIYLASHSNGVVWFDINTDKTDLQYLDNRQGLNSSYIEQMVTDNEHNIWFSTALGISRYKASENSFNNYSYYSYALGNAIKPSLCFSPQSNTMYIGGSNSVNFFNPSQIKTSGSIIFIGLKIFNEPIQLNGRPLTDGDKVKLNYRQSNLSVEFALLSYSNSFENRYSWKLDGLEDSWHVSYDNVAYYANLSPGKYTLLIKAANSNGVWSKEIKLLIVITPPFYKTWWFVLLIILMIAGITYSLVQFRIQQIKEKFRLRNKIAADLHDEIGSTLTSISILSNVSQQAMEQQPQQAKEMLQQISTQSKKIQQNMSDIVWSIRPDNEKIENLITRMREYAAQTLEPLDIKITIEADENLVNKILPMECRKELLLIYKEAINNIAKHAGATEVSTSLTSANRQIQLNIADNGNWKGNRSGTGTKSMKDRAIAIGGNLTIAVTETGTVVSVIIPVP